MGDMGGFDEREKPVATAGKVCRAYDAFTPAQSVANTAARTAPIACSGHQSRRRRQVNWTIVAAACQSYLARSLNLLAPDLSRDGIHHLQMENNMDYKRTGSSVLLAVKQDLEVLACG
jgi:hypothetical protein